MKKTIAKFDIQHQWTSIGIDLAKHDLSLAAISQETGEVAGIDRILNEDFFDLVTKLRPTKFYLEPCNGASAISAVIKNAGHEVSLIKGDVVSEWIKVFRNGQKNDLNDAVALAHIGLRMQTDEVLLSVRVKNEEEMYLLTLHALRKQIVEARMRLQVSLKGLLQNLGFIVKNRALSKELSDIENWLDENQSTIPSYLMKIFEPFINQLKEIDNVRKVADKCVEEAIKKDPRACKLLAIPGVGPQITCRLLATMGKITRFKRPRNLQAYYGLVPKEITTGHKVRHGRMTKHGDKEVRSLLIQGACSLLVLYQRNRLPDCRLQQWIKTKIDENMPYGKLVVALAAKMLRIIWAILKYDDNFDFDKAGVAKY